jgi:PPM family protein phosphatase
VATAVVRFTAAAVTDRGRKRSSNEDAYGYSVEHGVYVVCDGMGGAAAGEIASSLAVEEVLRLITERVSASASSQDEVAASLDTDGSGATITHPAITKLADEAVHAANEAIYSRAQRNVKLSGMGTTMVGILTMPEAATPEDDRRLWIMNIGDSRCYRLRNQRIELCTQDHSLVEEQIRLGKMTRLQAARSPLRNVITRALGTQPSISADLLEYETEPGDLFLLCSDGLTRELSDDRIESILNSTTGGLNPSEATLEELCNRLIQAANKAGGNDNITCLIVRVD